MYADRPTPSQRASPTRRALVFVFYELVACIWCMISFLLAMVAYGRTLAAFPTFLEAGVVALEVLDVTSQFFDHGDEALVVSRKLGIIDH